MKRRLIVTTAVAAASLIAASAAAWAAGSDQNTPLGESLVGRQADGSVLTPENKYVTPAGATIEQEGQPIDLLVRPDGQTAVSLTKSQDTVGQFTVIDLAQQKVLQVFTPPDGVGSGNVSVGGLLYSHDGKTLWAAQSNNILRFDVADDGALSHPHVIATPTAGPAGTTPPTSPAGDIAEALPSDLQWAPDGKHILVVLNGYNSLGVLDPTKDRFVAQVAVGMVPRDVVVIGHHAFVSNEAGRRPTDADFTNYSYDSPVVAETTDGRASTGTISEVNLWTKKIVATYDVGLDPTSMLVHGTEVLVTNSSDDTVSVLDTTTHEVTQTFNVNPVPGQPYGSSPNALAFLDSTHLVVSLGRDNALAVYDYEGAHTAAAFEGLIPTAWYPAALQWNDALHKLVVTNMKGVGSLGRPRTVDQGPGTTPVTGHQTYADRGVVQLIDRPTPRDISAYTAQVFSSNQWNGLADRNRIGTGDATPVAVPRRIGDPSKIKHVFLIVRENRTYDQELGDDPRGNGDPAYAQFAGVTPNAHALAREFPLIDNLYSGGTNSATGHTWLDAGFVNDYLERSYANYVRDYGQPDAMVYPKSGFLWDNAQAHGLKARVWGEYAPWFTKPNGVNCGSSWAAWYRDSQIMEGKIDGELHQPVGYCQTKSDVPSLDRILDRDFPNFQTNITDQYRADLFNQDLKKFEKNGNLPALNMLWVMDDHTEGTSPDYPTPSAMVADNDLATGRIIDAISHSKYWKDSAVFVVEDDSQNGVDHVDGHRNVTLLASPYARRGAVVNTYYSQENITRTIEQILGLPPMNKLDMTAVPMYDLFTDKPNFKPYDVRPNTIPLDTMNPSAKTVTDPMQRSWLEWSQQQDFSSEDQLPFAPFNRLTWYASTGWSKAYPGDTKIMTPDEVLRKFPQRAPSTDPDGTLPETKALVPHTTGR